MLPASVHRRASSSSFYFRLRRSRDVMSAASPLACAAVVVVVVVVAFLSEGGEGRASGKSVDEALKMNSTFTHGRSSLM